MSASLRSLSLRAMRPASKLSTVSFAPSSALLRAAPLSTQTVQRPTSPHVTIYRWPVPAISSIMNRVTGVGMGVGVIGMSFVALGGGCDIPAYVEVVKTSIPMAMPAIKMVISFPIVYHYAAGVRHIYWDRTAKHLDLESVEKSSVVVIGASAAIAFALGFYTLPALQ